MGVHENGQATNRQRMIWSVVGVLAAGWIVAVTQHVARQGEIDVHFKESERAHSEIKKLSHDLNAEFHQFMATEFKDLRMQVVALQVEVARLKKREQ